MLVLESVCERDIDLLLLEELHCDAAFAMWFLDQVHDGQANGPEMLSACHSVCHGDLGESDLVILYQLGDSHRLGVLVENKIDAAPQPRQAQRYRQRGEYGVQHGQWDAFYTCIIAPDHYLQSRESISGYDSKVSYEAVRDFLQVSRPGCKRTHYRLQLLQWAIEQQRRGYTPRVDERVTRFYRDYWRFASMEFAELGMKEPGVKPKQSTFLYFSPPGMPRHRRIVHKMVNGYVDLTLSQADPDKATLEEKLKHLLADSLTVVQTGKSISIRAHVPIVDHTREFDDQVSSVREALKAANRMFYLMQVIQAYQQAGDRTA